MTHCSLLGQVVVANVAEAENMMEVAPFIGGDEVPVASGDEGHALIRGGTDDSTDERAFHNENSRTYNLGASTITHGRYYSARAGR
jgi:hypothetical protein